VGKPAPAQILNMKTFLWIIGGGLFAWVAYRLGTGQPIIPSSTPAPGSNAPATPNAFWSGWGGLATSAQTQVAQASNNALASIGKSVTSAFGGSSGNSSGPSAPSTSGSGSGAPSASDLASADTSDYDDFGGSGADYGDDGSDYGDDA
jgi:hypothetical protein